MDPRRLLSGTLLPASDDDEPAPRLSLESGHRALIERWLPKRAAKFVAVAIGMPTAVWLLALVLAEDRLKFLGSRDWMAQPLYFTAHLAVVRLFVTTYTRHFREGVERLDPLAAPAVRPRVEKILGLPGLVVAVLLALPLIGADLADLVSGEVTNANDLQGSPGHPAATDILLGALWSVEWLLNAYVWVLLVAFAVLTIRTIEAHRFAAPIEVVLHERHYRPFLTMSAQGASIMVGYTAATALYVFLTRGVVTDYVGLWITGGLLLFSFVPPWVRLKARVAQQVRDETHRLAESVFSARRRMRAADDGTPAVTNEEIGARLDVVLSILELDHLDRLYADLGRSEGKAILLRLLAPLSTVVLKVLRP